MNALVLASSVLVPVETHIMALNGLAQLIKTISFLKKDLNVDLNILGILPCRVNSNIEHTKEVIQELKKRFNKKVFNSVIRENIELAKSPMYGTPIFLKKYK